MGFLSHLLAPQASRDPGDERWWQAFSPMTASGQAVSEGRAMRTSAVYGCVKVLSESVGQLPIHVYQRVGEGRDRADDHPVEDLMRYPNRINTGSEWRETMQGHVSLRGNAYSAIEVGVNRSINALVPMHPDRVTVRMTPDRELLYDYREPETVARSAGKVTFLQGEVLHLRGLSDDGIMGLSPIQQMRESVGMALAAEDYGARFFANDTQGGMIIEMPGTFKDEAAAARFKLSWQEMGTGGNRHKVRVLEAGAKAQKLGMTNKDAQFLEARKYQLEDIARAFRVPLHLLNSLDRATFNNIEHLGLEFVVHTLGPWLNKWEEAIGRSLIGEDESRRFYVEFLVDAFLRGDIKSRYEAYASGISASWLAPNEVRKRENLSPLPGLDQPLQPLNMAPAGSNAEQAAAIVRREADGLRASLREHGPSSAFLNSLKDIYQGVADDLRAAGLNEFAAMAYCETGKRIIRASGNLPALIESLPAERVPELAQLMNRTKVVTA